MSKQITPEGRKTGKIRQDTDVGVVHIEIVNSPLAPDETSHRYQFVAIEASTRWVYTQTYCDTTAISIGDFLRRLTLASPIKIVKILTDGNLHLTNFFYGENNKPPGNHAFNLICTGIDIERHMPSPMKNMTELIMRGIRAQLHQTKLSPSADSKKEDPLQP